MSEELQRMRLCSFETDSSGFLHSAMHQINAPCAEQRFLHRPLAERGGWNLLTTKNQRLVPTQYVPDIAYTRQNDAYAL